ncbi:hypothetical protein ACSFBX_20630 [Variovorax sp. RB2P76]|uniref:hypothetical protein n=1 Tax=Variovorax sp. RB2P76 TaxID=3443736 RepID=UPI003F465479
MSEIHQENLPGSERHRQPPAGYESWLEYAVDTFDCRWNILDALLEDSSPDLKEWIEGTAWAELNDLRVRSGLAPVERRSKRR